VHDGARFSYFAFGTLGLRDGGSHQLSDTGSGQIGRLCDPDVTNPFAVATEQGVRVEQLRAEVKAEVHPIGVRGGEDEGAAGPVGEREVIGDGVDLVNELVGFRSLLENQVSRGQCELLNRLRVRQEES